MIIGPEEVRRVARLAALEVQEADVESLARELDQIVGYVGQLRELESATPPPASALVPTALRPDLPQPPVLEQGPAAWAPQFAEGFFLVPRLEAME